MAEQEKDMEKTDETAETIDIAEENSSAEEMNSEETAADENSVDSAAEEESEEESDEEESKGGWAGKRTAKKQAKQDKKLETYKEQIDQLEDKVRRQLAEFENFRNRTEKEKTAMFETGAKSVLEKILPVVDNFERGLATVPEENMQDPFVDGMNRVYKQLMTELEGLGVKPIEAVGQEFDPSLHNAVMQVESQEYESGVVAQELQKGYTYRDGVVRHSMVAVTQ